MVKKKRKNTIDINQRKKQVNYQRKVTQDSDRFSDDIIEQKSKLKQRMEPANDSGLSSFKQQPSIKREAMKPTIEQPTITSNVSIRQKPNRQKYRINRDYGNKRVADTKRFQQDIVKKQSKLMQQNQFNKREVTKQNNEQVTASGNVSIRQKPNRQKYRVSQDYGNKRVVDTKRFQQDIVKKQSKLAQQNRFNKCETTKQTSKPVTMSGIVSAKPTPNRQKYRISRDYRNKRVADTKRFQQDIVKKQSKLVQQQRKVMLKRPKTKEIVQNNQRKQYQKKKFKEHYSQTNKSHAKAHNETYDPLGKDLDNDGIIDRYDHDFMDSDYQESTFDIDGLQQNKNMPSVEKSKPKKKIVYRYRKNKLAKEAETQSVNQSEKPVDTTLENKPKIKQQKKTPKQQAEKKQVILKKDVKPINANSDDDSINLTKKQEKNYLKKEIKLDKKQAKLSKLYTKPKYRKTSKVLKNTATASFIASEYIRTGSDENVGVEAAEKGLRIQGTATSHLQHRIQRKRRNPLKDQERYLLKHRKNFAKSQYRSYLERRPKEEFQKRYRYKQMVKRRQMKKKIYEQNKVTIGFKARAKKQLGNVIKASREVIKRNIKKIAIIVLGILLGFMAIQSIMNVIFSGITSINSEILTTTYLSDEDVLKNMNQEFSSYEYSLQSELENLETTHPGYDEYVINWQGDIGHNVYELLSYITARYGPIEKVSDITAELATLFNQVYNVTYETEVEVRYKLVCTGTGASQECKQEPYNWYKLIATVHKKSIDSVAREEFADYKDNLLHYETLMETKGNMEETFGSGGGGNISEIIHNPDFSNPGIAYDDASVKALFNEAEKHIGKRYVFGGNGPANFDCSSFVCWSYTHSGLKNMPRTTAYQIYTNYCNPVSPSEAKAGDIIFFHSTYNAGEPISHVGIYAGNGYMLHAGDPIQYTSINQPYWQQHFYAFGRPK